MIDPPTDAIVVEDISDRDAVRVRLNRPEKLNSLTPEQTSTLISVFESIEIEDATAIVLAGTGEDFCTGADVSTFDADGDDGFEPGLMHELVDSLRGCPVPVISRVEGRAFGAGFMLCMASDVVVATENTQFGLQEVKIGLPVEGYTATLLSRIVGEHLAREWLLTGSVVSAERAREAGFVSRISSPGELDGAIDSYVSTFEDNSSATMATLKARMADPSPSETSADIREAEREAVERALGSAEVRERIEAILDS